MSTRSRFIETSVAEYAAAHTTPADEVALDLRAATLSEAAAWAQMQIGDDQARFMELLARGIGARHAIEIGTFTGYSALAVARGMGHEGRLLCCDVSAEWTAVARRFWERAGVEDRIELRLGPAIETLRSLPDEPTFDLAFIDADKTGYADYLGEILPRLHEQGIVLVDNTLQDGRVLDSVSHDASVLAIQAFNDAVVADPRLTCVLLPIGDGLTLIQKRGS
jgi:caffeoyl-CoA O-methyltransferase